MEFRQSLEVPAFKNQDGSAECHCRIEQCVETVLQNELRAHMLFVRYGADYIECGKIRHQIGRPSGNPAGEAVRHERKSAQVFGKAANHEQLKREHCRKQGRGK